MGRRKKISKGPELTQSGLVQGLSAKQSFAAKHLPTFVKAANFVKAKFFSASSGPVTAKAFVIQQGVELGLTRPLSFAPDGFYIEDLGFFLEPGQRQDMGALFTQRQINESHDLKCALVDGNLTAEWGNPADTVPISDPAVITGSVTVGDVIVTADDQVYAEQITPITTPAFDNFAAVRAYSVKTYKRKTLVLVNTGVVNVRVRGWASVDEGANFVIPMVTSTDLVPGGVIMVDKDTAFTDFRWDVERGSADGEVTTYGYAYRI
jgi:hypothetical protein